MEIKKFLYLALYYGFAYYLPPTNSGRFGKMGGQFVTFVLGGLLRNAVLR